MMLAAHRDAAITLVRSLRSVKQELRSREGSPPAIAKRAHQILSQADTIVILRRAAMATSGSHDTVELHHAKHGGGVRDTSGDSTTVSSTTEGPCVSPADVVVSVADACATFLAHGGALSEMPPPLEPRGAGGAGSAAPIRSASSSSLPATLASWQASVEESFTRHLQSHQVTPQSATAILGAATQRYPRSALTASSASARSQRLSMYLNHPWMAKPSTIKNLWISAAQDRTRQDGAEEPSPEASWSCVLPEPRLALAHRLNVPPHALAPPSNEEGRQQQHHATLGCSAASTSWSLIHDALGPNRTSAGSRSLAGEVAACPPFHAASQRVSCLHDPLLLAAYRRTLQFARSQRQSAPASMLIELIRGCSVLYGSGFVFPPKGMQGPQGALPYKHRTFVEAKMQRCPDVRELLQFVRQASEVATGASWSHVDAHRAICTMAEEGIYDGAAADNLCAKLCGAGSLLSPRHAARVAYACGVLGHRHHGVVQNVVTASLDEFGAQDLLIYLQGLAMLHVGKRGFLLGDCGHDRPSASSSSLTSSDDSIAHRRWIHLQNRLWIHAKNPATTLAWHVDIHHAMAAAGMLDHKLLIHSSRLLRTEVHRFEPVHVLRMLYVLGSPLAAKREVDPGLHANWVKVEKLLQAIVASTARTSSDWTVEQQWLLRTALTFAGVGEPFRAAALELAPEGTG